MSATETFIATLSQTPQDAQALLDSLNRLDGDLDEIIEVLGYSKTVDQDLAKLDDAITVTLEALSVASVIPEVGEAAGALKATLSPLSQEVKAARKAADSLEAKVKPLREGLVAAQKTLKQLIDLVGKIQTESAAFLAEFTSVVNCVNSLPDGTYKTQAQSYLDSFSTAAQPVVAALNTALVETNTVITEFYDALKQVEQALSPLKDLSAAIDAFLNALQPVTDLLVQLENALKDIKITVPVPYPVTVSLYDVFTELTMFIDLAMAPIQDLVDQVLKALHVTLPGIPGLDDLINLHVDIPAIPDFDALYAQLTAAFDAFEALIKSFNLTCPPSSPDAQVPNGGVYKP